MPVIRTIRAPVAALFTRAPMRSFPPVNMTSGMSDRGREKLSTIWLITRLRVGSRLVKMITSEGTIVTRRRSHIGICRLRNPLSIIWPAWVTTVAEDNPEAHKEAAKTHVAA